jgi:nudix-type nucleoside diphosphatase (YffH/AdpP family)
LTETFLHAPFDGADVLTRILGEAPPSRPAALVDHVLRSDLDAVRVAPAVSDGGRVAGLVADLTDAQVERLDFVFAALGAVPAAVEVEEGGRRVAARAYRFEAAEAPREAWAADADTAECRARRLETVTEVMGHFGRRGAEEMRRLLPGITVRALARARGPQSGVPAPVLRSGLGAADVERAAREFSYARFFAMEEHRLRHRRFDGAMSDRLDRAVFTSGDAVTVLPYDPRRDTVLLIEQFRAGPHARLDPRPWCLETVAGRCDRSEPPEETARREAREEANLTLGRVERIAAYYPSPGIVAEHLTAFVGEADLGAAGGVHGLPEEHEDIRAVVVPLAAALAAIETGEINTAPLMLSLYWLERNAARLRAAWT